MILSIKYKLSIGILLFISGWFAGDLIPHADLNAVDLIEKENEQSKDSSIYLNTLCTQNLCPELIEKDLVNITPRVLVKGQEIGGSRDKVEDRILVSVSECRVSNRKLITNDDVIHQDSTDGIDVFTYGNFYLDMFVGLTLTETN